MNAGVEIGQLGSALKKGVARLESRNIPSARLAAELLLMHVLGRDRTWLYAHPEYELSPDETAAYAELIKRREQGIPTQYLTGRQEFWGLEFEVGRGVLIPRPETEHVIEVALSRLGDRKAEPLRIADVGTGSGCIAIALACELPRAEIVATDISATALGYARRNAQRHGMADRIQFLEADLLQCAGSPMSGGLDLIVSNPPYIGVRDAATMQPEVREHEPAEALFAGAEGFDLYPRLIEQAKRVLGANGILAFEIGYNAGNYVRSLLAAPVWSDRRVTRDLAGIERVVSANLSARSPSPAR